MRKIALLLAFTITIQISAPAFAQGDPAVELADFKKCMTKDFYYVETSAAVDEKGPIVGDAIKRGDIVKKDDGTMVLQAPARLFFIKQMIEGYAYTMYAKPRGVLSTLAGTVVLATAVISVIKAFKWSKKNLARIAPINKDLLKLNGGGVGFVIEKVGGNFKSSIKLPKSVTDYLKSRGRTNAQIDLIEEYLVRVKGAYGKIKFSPEYATYLQKIGVSPYQMGEVEKTLTDNLMDEELAYEKFRTKTSVDVNRNNFSVEGSKITMVENYKIELQTRKGIPTNVIKTLEQDLTTANKARITVINSFENSLGLRPSTYKISSYTFGAMTLISTILFISTIYASFKDDQAKYKVYSSIKGTIDGLKKATSESDFYTILGASDDDEVNKLRAYAAKKCNDTDGEAVMIWLTDFANAPAQDVAKAMEVINNMSDSTLAKVVDTTFREMADTSAH